MRINHIRGLKNNNKHLALNHTQLKQSVSLATGHGLRAHLAKSNHDVYEASGSGHNTMSVFTKPNNETNLSKLKSSLKAINLSNHSPAKPKYIEF